MNDYIHFQPKMGCARPSRKPKPPRITLNGIIAIGLSQSRETAISFQLTELALKQLNSRNFIPIGINKNGQAMRRIPSVQTQRGMAKSVLATLSEPVKKKYGFIEEEHDNGERPWSVDASGIFTKTTNHRTTKEITSEVHCG